MELDDFKHQNNSGQVPETDLNTRENTTVRSLVEEVKTKDAEAIKALLVLLITFAALGIIYITSIARNTGVLKAGYSLLAIGFVLTELFFYIKFRQQKKVDYAAPTLIFLKKAEQRYTYWSLTDKIVSLPLLLVMGLGGGLTVYGSFQKYFPGSWIPLIIYVLIFLMATAIGSWAGKKQWNKNNRAVFERIRALRREFEK